MTQKNNHTHLCTTETGGYRIRELYASTHLRGTHAKHLTPPCHAPCPRKQVSLDGTSSSAKPSKSVSLAKPVAPTAAALPGLCRRKGQSSSTATAVDPAPTQRATGPARKPNHESVVKIPQRAQLASRPAHGANFCIVQHAIKIAAMTWSIPGPAHGLLGQHQSGL